MVAHCVNSTMVGDDSDGNGKRERYDDDVEDDDIVVSLTHSEAGSPNICRTHVNNGGHSSTVFLSDKYMTVIRLAEPKVVLASLCLLMMMIVACFSPVIISVVAIVDRGFTQSRAEPTPPKATLISDVELASLSHQIVESRVPHDSDDDLRVGSRSAQRTVMEQSANTTPSPLITVLNDALVKRSHLVVHFEPEAPYLEDPTTRRTCSWFIFGIQVWEDANGLVSLYYGVFDTCQDGTDKTDERMSLRKTAIRSVGGRLSTTAELITYWFPVSEPDGPRVSYPMSYNYTNSSRIPMYMFSTLEISELGTNLIAGVHNPAEAKSRVAVVSTALGNRSTVLTDTFRLWSLAFNPARTKLYITNAMSPIRLLSADTRDGDTLIDNWTTFKAVEAFTAAAAVHSISSIYFVKQSFVPDGSCLYFTDNLQAKVWSITAPDLPEVNLTLVAGSGGAATVDGPARGASFGLLREVVTTAEGCNLFVTEDSTPGYVHWIKLDSPCSMGVAVEPILRSNDSGFWGLALHDDGVDLYLYVGTTRGDIIELQLDRSRLHSCDFVTPLSSSRPPVHDPPSPVHGAPPGPPPIDIRGRNNSVVVIAAAAVSSTIFFMLLTIVAVYIWRRHKQAKREQLSTARESGKTCSQVDVDMSEDTAEALDCGRGKEIHPTQLKVFTLQDLEQSTDNFSDNHKVGETGAFGSVYRGVVNGVEVAMKVMTGQFTDMKRRQFLAEINTLGRVHHANLIPLIGYCHASDQAILVYPYFPGGSLHARLHERVVDSRTQLLHAPLTLLERINVASQIGRGLSYLHKGADPPVLHRDIKSSNVLLDDCREEGIHVVVADFGLAAIGERVFGTTHEIFVKTSHVAGTYGYMSPEYFLHGFLTDRNDVYAFGVILLELLTGRRVVMPSPSGTGMETLVFWVKRFLEDPSVDLPDAILDPALCKGYQMEVRSLRDVAMKITQLAMECVKNDDRLRPRMSGVARRMESLFEEANEIRRHEGPSGLIEDRTLGGSSRA
ncbi:hypothetical protein CBR_g45770 [Chara braunii]|uniref:Protein kinase domain-containing protein n=1 Tax=Chara braunii TaxID=69332 RepID=A0A388LZ70_CHABU|nr:hypothetical protein CBR_g45770 [Chara braunii]|eukprot:GBG87618.1 hypothetical protein CBR_g45770 [Chara braunii]